MASSPPPNPVDHPRIERAVREILLAVGEDPERNGLQGTPGRIARMYEEILSGEHVDPTRHLKVTFAEDHHEMVVVKDIPFDSMCEHHMMPFYGKAHIAYTPVERVVGLSKLARLTDIFARRLQTQEHLTAQIAAAIDEVLKPRGVAVLIEAEHTCMSVRGVAKHGASTFTSRFTGMFRDNPAEQARFLSMVRGMQR